MAINRAGFARYENTFLPKLVTKNSPQMLVDGQPRAIGKLSAGPLRVNRH
jgi:hypothetical protein